MRLVVTRPEPDAERTAAALRARGHSALVMPMLRIENTGNADLGVGPWAAVLMTSANAARAISTHPRLGELIVLPTFVVGEATRAAAQAEGFGSVVSADGDAAALARVVADHVNPAGRSLIYLAGEQRTRELEDMLRSGGCGVRTVAVYRAVPNTDLSPMVKTALLAGEIDGVLHFSKRSAAAFVAAAEAAGQPLKLLGTRHYCLSAQVAEAFANKPVGALRVATQPNEQALMALIDAG
jgi:uroporphyrinogen-III synthase